MPGKKPISVVIASFKKSSRPETAICRSISLTFVVSKLIEHTVHSHIVKHLEQHQILTDHQYVFHAKRSTETQLIQTIHDISKTLITKNQLTIFDFTKTFDKVPHKRLIHKLKHYGITGSIATRTENFLTGRSQQVPINGTTSSPTSYFWGTSGNRPGATRFPYLHKRSSRQLLCMCTPLRTPAFYMHLSKQTRTLLSYTMTY